MIGCIDLKVGQTDYKEVDMISEIKYNKDTKLLSFLITNKSNSTLTYGFGYTIEIQKVTDSKIEWKLTNLTDDLAFIEMLALIEKGKTSNDTISLYGLKEAFTKGVYRIVRTFNNDTKSIIAYIEFNVDEKLELSDFKYYDNLYRNLSGGKGLELYVSKDTKINQIYCGLLDGTNRNKTEEDFKIVRDNPVTVESAAKILSTYKKDIFVFVLGLDKPLTDEIKTYLKSYFDKLEMPNIQYQG
jgi:hypothetical protein